MSDTATEPIAPGVPEGRGGGDVLAAVARRRRSRVPLISAIAVGCLAAVLIAVLAASKSASNGEAITSTPLANKAAPDIRGPLLNGGQGDLYAYKGKWVLLNFFASWCVPCQQEQADLVKFQNANSQDAVIFGVRFDDPDVGPIEQMMSKSGARWPIVDDPNAKIDYSVTGPPESFLISPAGIVLAHIVGEVNAPQLQSLLNEEMLVVTTPTGAGAPSGSGAPAASAG